MLQLIPIHGIAQRMELLNFQLLLRFFDAGWVVVYGGMMNGGKVFLWLLVGYRGCWPKLRLV